MRFVFLDSFLDEQNNVYSQSYNNFKCTFYLYTSQTMNTLKYRGEVSVYFFENQGLPSQVNLQPDINYMYNIKGWTQAVELKWVSTNFHV